jgi:hypothetical protein
MKNIWKVGVLALAIAFTFSSCGDDTTETPAPTNTTDELVGTYTGLSNFTFKTGTLTGGLVPDQTESDTVSVVVTKSTGGFTLTVDDNDPSTPADPTTVNVNEVTLASNGTSFQLPSQSFEIDSAEFITIVGLKSYTNGTTPVAGLYTRADKKLKFKAGSTIPFPINDTTEIPVTVEFEFNVNKK